MLNQIIKSLHEEGIFETIVRAIFLMMDERMLALLGIAFIVILIVSMESGRRYFDKVRQKAFGL
jgi:hypothetical protein